LFFLPGGRNLTFQPDALSRIDTIRDSFLSGLNEGIYRYDYMGPARVLNRTAPNGTKLTLQSGYDNARRIVDFANQLPAGVTGALAEFTYGYDLAGNRLYERRVHEPTCTDCSNRKGETYTYDAVYRLKGWKEGDLNDTGQLQGTASTTKDFTLDGLGNWKSYKNNAVTYTNTVNSLNQYSTFNGQSGNLTLTYDFIGNLVDRTVFGTDQRYSYDFSNRLVRYLDALNNLTTYQHDALGRRIAKVRQGSLVTHYIYDGDRMIEERDGANVLQASYVYGSGADEVLSRRHWPGGTSTDLFYHTNALGSVVALTDSLGAVVERYKYDAYGQVTVMDGNFVPRSGGSDAIIQNNLLFTGRYYDTESFTYYYRARNYHPYLGRFLQRDPLGESASLNLYAYVFGNPINAEDPTGMMSLSQAQQTLASLKSASSSAWEQRQAQDAQSMSQAFTG
jgi:RHS repeat-associated protein